MRIEVMKRIVGVLIEEPLRTDAETDSDKNQDDERGKDFPKHPLGFPASLALLTGRADIQLKEMMP
jgi:hypothetical protein